MTNDVEGNIEMSDVREKKNIYIRKNIQKKMITV